MPRDLRSSDVLASAPKGCMVVAVASISGQNPKGQRNGHSRKHRNEIGTRNRLRRPASSAQVQRTIAALEANGITVIQARDGAEAKRRVLELIPEGAQVYHGASQTLELTGITSEIDTSGRYEAVGPRVRAMDRATEGATIRRMTAAPDVMLGSIHALTETGSLLAASAGGQPVGPVRRRRGQGDPRRRHAEDRGRMSRKACGGSTSTRSRSRTLAPRRRTGSTAASTRS